jgi:methylmalonyl-CoA/ethylmalonyl-CoA epimerase
MVSKIDHIGIVVEDLEKSLRSYQELLGLDLKETEELDVRGSFVRAAFLPVEGVMIELLEVSGTEGSAPHFLTGKGMGIHHIAFKVDNLESVFEELREKGAKFMWDKIQHGSRGTKVTFFEPTEFDGIYIELVEKKE